MALLPILLLTRFSSDSLPAAYLVRHGAKKILDSYTSLTITSLIMTVLHRTLFCSRECAALLYFLKIGQTYIYSFKKRIPRPQSRHYRQNLFKYSIDAQFAAYAYSLGLVVSKMEGTFDTIYHITDTVHSLNNEIRKLDISIICKSDSLTTEQHFSILLGQIPVCPFMDT